MEHNTDVTDIYAINVDALKTEAQRAYFGKVMLFLFLEGHVACFDVFGIAQQGQIA